MTRSSLASSVLGKAPLSQGSSPLRAAADSADLAAICKAVADPLRLDILRVLINDSFAVQELAAIFTMPQPGMSHHLKVLLKAGLLATRRQGNTIFYRRALLRIENDFYDFLVSLFGTIGALALASETAAGIAKVYEERSAQSRLYFDRNVDKFEENQGMLCELSQYLPNLKEILDLAQLPRASRVMEVGPGQGDLLRELTKRYDQLIALDNSQEMLTFTQNKLKATSRDSIHFVQSSLEAYEAEGKPLDAVVLNMVLHHLASPLKAFQKARSLVQTEACLIIADLCSHNQEWTRSSCGDVWLGFDPQDLKDWAAASGWNEEQSLYLGLKNGFQIQLKLFRAI